MELSNCCKVVMLPVGDITKHYRCTMCGNSCDAYAHKSIEEWQQEVAVIARESVDHAVKFITNVHEEILMAFYAKYKCQPDEIVIIHAGNKVYFEKKVNTDERVKRLMRIVKRAAKNSCCICCDSCLACDATDLLKEMGEIK